MNPPVYEVEIKGLTEQVMKLANFNTFAGIRFKRAGELAVYGLEKNWKRLAPVDTGRYRSSITGRVKSVVGANIVAVVGTNVTSARGFPYPYALEHSMRYHYRRGPRQGQFTFNRVRRVLKRARGSIKRLFNDAVNLIVKDLEI